MKVAILPKLMYGFSALPIKIPANFFIEIGILIPMFTWKIKGFEVDKIILKKNQIRKIYISQFQKLLQSNIIRGSMVVA